MRELRGEDKTFKTLGTRIDVEVKSKELKTQAFIKDSEKIDLRVFNSDVVDFEEIDLTKEELKNNYVRIFTR